MLDRHDILSSTEPRQVAAVGPASISARSRYCILRLSSVMRSPTPRRSMAMSTSPPSTPAIGRRTARWRDSRLIAWVAFDGAAAQNVPGRSRPTFCFSSCWSERRWTSGPDKICRLKAPLGTSASSHETLATRRQHPTNSTFPHPRQNGCSCRNPPFPRQ